MDQAAWGPGRGERDEDDVREATDQQRTHNGQLEVTETRPDELCGHVQATASGAPIGPCDGHNARVSNGVVDAVLMFTRGGMASGIITTSCIRCFRYFYHDMIIACSDIQDAGSLL